jgi:hypothetical protein
MIVNDLGAAYCSDHQIVAELMHILDINILNFTNSIKFLEFITFIDASLAQAKDRNTTIRKNSYISELQ